MSKKQVLFNVTLRYGQLLSNYIDSTDTSAKDALDFIFKNRHNIVKDFNYNLFKEMTLNYRTYFKKEQKTKIISDYKKYVMSKPKHHKSDLAIGFSIVKFVHVDIIEEQVIIDFMFEVIKENLRLEYQNLDVSSSKYFIKKKLVIDFIEKKVLTKKKL